MVFDLWSQIWSDSNSFYGYLLICDLVLIKVFPFWLHYLFYSSFLLSYFSRKNERYYAVICVSVFLISLLSEFWIWNESATFFIVFFFAGQNPVISKSWCTSILKLVFLVINPGTDITYYLKWLSFCLKIYSNIINLSFQIILLFMIGNATISNCNAVFRFYIYYLVELLIRIIFYSNIL